MKPRIIAFQTSVPGQEICRREFVGLGLKEGVDFVLIDYLYEIPNLIEPGKRQLLVLGSIRNSTRGIASSVVDVISQNDKLVRMAFTSAPIDGVEFDCCIEKGFGVGSTNPITLFREAVRGFLQGSLNRAKIFEPA